MKANKIINSINLVINEDKFSKYTYRQIYDELGKEDFFDYIDDIVKKTIKNIKGLNQAWAGKDDFFTFSYIQAPVQLVIAVWEVTLFIRLEKMGTSVWEIESNPKQTNISEFIKKNIIEGCKRGKIPIT